MTRDTKEKIGALLVLLSSLFLIGIGLTRDHKIYDSADEEFGIISFLKIPERDLIIDTTFSGVTRRDDRLYTTYDRTSSRGKRSCPT